MDTVTSCIVCKCELVGEVVVCAECGHSICSSNRCHKKVQDIDYCKYCYESLDYQFENPNNVISFSSSFSIDEDVNVINRKKSKTKDTNYRRRRNEKWNSNGSI